MSAEYVIAIDAGTGSCRAALFDADGRCHAVAAREWRHPAEAGVPGGRRFDTDAGWALVSACVREALAGVPAHRVRAVSTTSLRGGLVLLDARGKVLWACPNGDGRAGAEARALVESGAAAALQARGGDWVSLAAPALLHWLRRHEPGLVRQAARICLINDWLVHRLTGVLATDPSVGSSSGLFALADRDWSAESLALCGLEAGMVPAVQDAGTVVAAVHASAAEATGLASGTPVVVGGADTAMGLLGLGVAEPGRCVALGGTFWQQSLTSDTPVLDPSHRLRTLCHALPGQWLVEGIGFHCGLALRWFRDAFCDAERAEAAQLGVDAYELMERQAARVAPGADGVVAILSNTMDARAWRHAAPGFVGIDLQRPEATGKAAFIRAIQESAAYVVRGHVEQLEAVAARRFDTLLFAGGAAHGRLWPQIVADVLRRDVQVPGHREATVRGAALAAGVGAGWSPDLAGAIACAEAAPAADRAYAPDAAAAHRYDALYTRWQEVYAAALAATDAGLGEPLWRAPGT